MDCLKSNNFVVHSAMLPGMYAESTYNTVTFAPKEDEGDGAIGEASVKNPIFERKARDGSRLFDLRTLYIPFDRRGMAYADILNSPGRYIPAILQVAPKNSADIFVIFLHGNACDAGQTGECAKRESPYFNAHYLVVEYPGYGLADGFSTQSLIEAVVYSVYTFVVHDLKVDPSKVVIIGRSVGTGVASFLSAKLQSLDMPPAAVVLHSAYTNIRDVARDILGCVPASLFLDRWSTWDKLCYRVGKSKTNAALDPPLAPNYGAMATQVKPQSSFKVTAPSFTQSPASTAENTPAGEYHVDTGREPGDAKGEGEYEKESKGEIEDKKQDDKIRSAQSVSAAPPSPLANSDLVVRLRKAPYSVVLSPVLFIHADQDAVIDYHHSVTLHQRRLKDKLPSELFTQRSNHWTKKDHNRFDYHVDYLVPVRDFLRRKVGVAEHGAGLVLDTSILLQHCIIPAQYRSRHTQSLGEKAAGNAVVGTQKKEQKRKPRQAGPMGVVEIIANGCSVSLCCRCCWTCIPGFCMECNVALCKTGVMGAYTTVVDDEPDFTYTTKSQRRGSGDGLSVAADRPVSRRGDVVILEQPQDQRMESRGGDVASVDAKADAQAAMEKEANASGKETEAVGIFERFAGLVARPADGQAQAAGSRESGVEYVPG